LGVYYALLTGVKGMALATDFNPQTGLGGPSLESVATGASYRGGIKLGMNFCLHTLPLVYDIGCLYTG
jgi:hypothetical protein